MKKTRLDITVTRVGFLLTNRMRQQMAQKQTEQNPMRRDSFFHSLGRKGGTRKLKPHTTGLIRDESEPGSGCSEWEAYHKSSIYAR